MSDASKILDRIRQLVAAPSVSSVLPEWDTSNRAVIEVLAGWLEPAGFDVEIVEIPGSPGKFNLIASRGRGPGGLVLAGHTDTVPCDPELWQRDPFQLTESDGRLYGLGTSDMKAFLALAFEASQAFETADLNEPLIILATADEESSMAGARDLVRTGRPRARGAVIGEPTRNRPVRMHKGVMMERIRVTGRSGHSSDPDLGRSALEGMHELIGQLLELRRDLQGRYKNPLFKIPVPTLNLGHIHGGDNPNRICGECVLDIDLRPLPGMALDELRDLLRDRLSPRMRERGLEVAFQPLFDGTPAMETPADSPLVKLAEELTGCPAEAVAFGTEGPYLRELDMDVVIMGPGSIDVAHQPDEYLDAATVKPTVKWLEQLIHHHCASGDKQ